MQSLQVKRKINKEIGKEPIDQKTLKHAKEYLETSFPKLS